MQLRDEKGPERRSLGLKTSGKNDKLESVDVFEHGALVLAAVDQREFDAQDVAPRTRRTSCSERAASARHG